MPSAAELWIRRLHIYIGLYFLFFLWLFTLSGVVLNHPKWRVTEFWSGRSQNSREVRIARPSGSDDLSVCRGLIQQIGIRGEIVGKINRAGSGVISFRAVRPGDIYNITANLDGGHAKIEHIHVNGWGVINMLHSFTGVRRSDPSVHQNWWATGVWRFSMDALSAGLAMMVLSGICLLYTQTRRRWPGLIALLLGIFTLGIFLSI